MNEQVPTFQKTATDQIVHEIASPIMAVRNGREIFVSGTAFMIGPGLAVTAYHVLADLLERYDGVREVESQLTMSFEILLFLTLDAGANALPMKVLRVWRSAPLDLAVLAIGIPEERHESHRWKIPHLRLLPPKVGTRIAAFGFPASTVEQEDHSDMPTVDLKAHTTTGIVEEIHHVKRDSSQLPFPCYRTDARFDGGMSGGPVFDETGHICGVVCSSIGPSHPGESHISFIASLWPIVGTLIDAAQGSASGGAYYPLFDLFTSGVLRASDLSQVGLEVTDDGARVPRATYSAALWEGTKVL